MKTAKHRYTLCFHEYIGYGGYNISFKRILTKPELLDRYRSRSNLHFIINGWPDITHPDGSDYFTTSEIVDVVIK